MVSSQSLLSQALQVRLVWLLGFLNGAGGKPRGMHGHTFEQLKAEHDAFVRVLLAEMRLRFRLIGHELDGMGVDLDEVYRGG